MVQLGRRGGSREGVVVQGKALWFNGKAWWFKGRRGGSREGVVVQGKAWWFNGKAWWFFGKAWWFKGRHGGSREGMVVRWEGVVVQEKAWWFNDSTSDCCPAVLGSNPVSPQPAADWQFSGGLPPGMALGCGLTSVRGDRGENYENAKTFNGVKR